MRTLRGKHAALVLGVLGLCGANWLRGQQAAKPLNVDGKVLRSAGNVSNDALPGSWLSYGRNQGETRYSTLKQINDSNAKRLGLAWTYAVGAGGGNQEGTPLMWNNTLFGITTWSVVYALDARTGKELWRWDPEVNQTAVRPKICCGIVNRGIALYNGMIIAPVNDGRLQALDALTGKPVWESRVAFPQDLYTLTMAPRIAGDKVIIGASGGDKATRGFFAAFDAKTGNRAWKFYTVPGNPELPPENEAMKAALKTWGGDFWTKGGGGAHNWSPMSYSPNTGYVYIPVFLQPYTYEAQKEFRPGSTGYARSGRDPKLIDSPAIGPPTAEGMRGALQAWDPVNQKLAWRIEGGGGIGGGAVATAGNLAAGTVVRSTGTV